MRTQVDELMGDRSLDAIALRNGGTATSELPVRALFVFIGADPRTNWLSGVVELDDKGFVLTGSELASVPNSPAAPLALETSEPGVFAVGDVRSGSIKRVASAVGEGSMAVRMVHQHLAAD